jgi:hypothetical protein
MDEKIEVLSKQYERVNHWINLADTKAGALLAFHGIMLTITFDHIDNVKTLVFSDFWHFLLIIGVFAFSVASIIFAVLVFIPKLENSTKQRMKFKSLIYFNEIAERSFDDFSEEAIKTYYSNPSEMEKDYLRQIWINSKIAKSKFSKVLSSFRCLMGAFTFYFLLIITYFIL